MRYYNGNGEVIEDEDVPITDSAEPIEETSDPDEPSEMRPLVKKPKMPTYAELKQLPLSEICKSISDKHQTTRVGKPRSLENLFLILKIIVIFQKC